MKVLYISNLSLSEFCWHGNKYERILGNDQMW